MLSFFKVICGWFCSIISLKNFWYNNFTYHLLIRFLSYLFFRPQFTKTCDISCPRKLIYVLQASLVQIHMHCAVTSAGGVKVLTSADRLVLACVDRNEEGYGKWILTQQGQQLFHCLSNAECLLFHCVRSMWNRANYAREYKWSYPI
jgi:hypothetical protein